MNETTLADHSGQSSPPCLAVAVLVGSLRAGSISRRIAKALIERAPRGLRCAIVEIGDLALYNEDLDHGSPPHAWSDFRSELGKADAVLFVTPEYNRSIPGCLKNALDVGSRPAGRSVFDGLPAGVVSVTPYKLGAFGANHALRQTFSFLNMPVMQQPEAYLGKAGDIVDDDGNLKDQEAGKLLTTFMTSFENWVHVVHARNRVGEFDAFMRERQRVARDYVNGETASLEAICTRRDPATFMSPRGDVQRGASDIVSRYSTDAKSFRPGSSTNLEILQSGACGDLAFWTGLQHAEVRMAGSDGSVPMTLRITEVFRFEDGGYKLVHRHADTAEKKPQ